MLRRRWRPTPSAREGPRATRGSGSGPPRAGLVALALALPACGVSVPLGNLPPEGTGLPPTGASSTNQLEPTTGDADAFSTSTTGDFGPRPLHAYILPLEDWLGAESTGDSTAMGDDTASTTTTTGDGDGDSETLVVIISTGPDDCTAPHAALECGWQWTIAMQLPPALQLPGTYDLTQLNAEFASTGTPLDPPDTCSGSGGLLGGTAELTTVSAELIEGSLSITGTSELEANMEFSALGCG